MAIKKKTHLNLSGSHHTLDSDNAFVGGFLYVTGSVSASVGISASAGFQAGGASTFKAATFGGFVSASNYIATANNLQVGQNAFVTGSLQVTQSAFVQGTVSASQGIFTQLTGSLSGTTAGLPFLLPGTNMDSVSYNDATGQWTLNAHTVAPGTNFFTEIDSTHIYTTSSVALVHLSASSGAEITGSLEVRGGITGSISGTIDGNPFIIAGPNVTTKYNSLGQWEITGSSVNGPVGNVGDIQFNDGAGGHAAASTVGQTFVYYSASYGDYPAGTLVAPTASISSTLFVQGINVTPLYKSTSSAGTPGTRNIPSSEFLTFANAFGGTLGNSSIAAFDFTVVAAAQASDDYASWNFTATGIKDSTGATKLIDYLEVSQGSSGALGDTWAVNVYDDLSLGLTGSNSISVQWWMKASMKAGLSASGDARY